MLHCITLLKVETVKNYTTLSSDTLIEKEVSQPWKWTWVSNLLQPPPITDNGKITTRAQK